MRLLLVIDNLGSGGAQRQLVNLARELSRRGHQVEMFVYSRADHFRPLVEAAGVPIREHVKPSRWSFAPVRALRKAMRDDGFDLVLSFMSVPNAYCLLAAGRASARPKIVVSERFTRRTGKLALRQRMIEALYRRADHITVNSHHFRDYYDRKYPWMRSRISTIWNGVDMTAFEAAPPASGDGPLRLLCVGNMTSFKNWLVVPEALAILRDQHGLRPRVDWVGRLSSLTTADTEYLKAVEQAVARHRLEEQWTFLGPRADIPELLRSHDALVHPSYHEGLPNVVCEALAAGRPVIVSDTLDHPLLVQEGHSGFLFDWRRPESLAQAIARLARLSPRQRDEMGEAGRRFAQEHLSLERFADAYEKLFQRLLRGNSSGPAEVALQETATVDPVAQPAIAH